MYFLKRRNSTYGSLPISTSDKLPEISFVDQEVFTSIFFCKGFWEIYISLGVPFEFIGS